MTEGNDIPATTLSTVGQTSDGTAAERGAAAPAVGLPCQYNDNCIEKEEKYRPPSRASLTPNQKSVRHKMIMAVEWMVKKHGIERVGLLTLTFGVPGSGKGSYETWALRQQAKEWNFVQKRWHSFSTNIVAKRYEDWVCVFEMHRDRVWHLHVVVSKGINRVIGGKFMIHSLGTLIHRTRLKIAAGMLNFRDYGDFAEYFGPRWNYYLKDSIAWIPMPFRFLKGAFESGIAARLLECYAENPAAFLDDRGKAKLGDVARALWRRFTEGMGEGSGARSERSDNDCGDENDAPDDLQHNTVDDPNQPF